MQPIWILLLTSAIILLLILLTALICYRMAFYASRRKTKTDGSLDIPKGEIYDVFREDFERWAADTRSTPCTHYTVTSFDGLTLHGKFYEYAPGAPIELMFHGYRGTAERDLSGGLNRCFRLGRSAFIVDQRCSGKSGGHTITFGVYEHRDCLTWLKFVTEHFGEEIPVILTGISMGASTVLMAAGCPLPKNVIGVLADCGFTSAREIICKVVKQLGLPPKVIYPFIKLGAKLFGGFDLEETSAVEAMKRAKVPVIFFHGETDDFVPCDMSRKNYEACAADKKLLVTIPGAGHGLSFPVAPEEYLQALREFFGPEASHPDAGN